MTGLAKTKIGIFIGSVRNTSNSAGVAAFAKHLLHSTIPGCQVDNFYAKDYVSIPENNIPGKLVKKMEDYEDPKIQDLSRRVSSCQGLVFVCPEYNHSYPGALKIMIDHLYYEFDKKPTVIIAFGGHGALNASAALTNLLSKLGIDKLSVVNITIPLDYVLTPKRLSSTYDQVKDEFFIKFEEATKKAFEDLKSNIEASA